MLLSKFKNEKNVSFFLHSFRKKKYDMRPRTSDMNVANDEETAFFQQKNWFQFEFDGI